MFWNFSVLVLGGSVAPFGLESHILWFWEISLYYILGNIFPFIFFYVFFTEAWFGPCETNWIDLTFSPLHFISILHAGQFHRICSIILLDFKFLLSFFIFQKLIFSVFPLFITHCYCLIACNISSVRIWLLFFWSVALPFLFFPVCFFLFVLVSFPQMSGDSGLTIHIWQWSTKTQNKTQHWDSVFTDWACQVVGFADWAHLVYEPGVRVALLPQYLQFFSLVQVF